MIILMDTEDRDSIELFLKYLPSEWNLYESKYLEEAIEETTRALDRFGTAELKTALRQFADSL